MYFYLLMGNGICCAAARKIYIKIGYGGGLNKKNREGANPHGRNDRVRSPGPTLDGSILLAATALLARL